MSQYLLSHHLQSGVAYVQYGANFTNNIIIMCVTFFMIDYYDFKSVYLEVLVWYLVCLRPKQIERHYTGCFYPAVLSMASRKVLQMNRLITLHWDLKLLTDLRPGDSMVGYNKHRQLYNLQAIRCIGYFQLTDSSGGYKMWRYIWVYLNVL